MKNKTTYKELEIKRSWSLEQKVAHAQKRIKEFYDFTNGKCYISFSGGKDSTVLLHIARTIYPNIQAVFCNTTNEDPEIIKFVKSLPNVKTVYPKMRFKKVVQTYGFPFVSKKVSRSVKQLRNPSNKNANVRNLYMTGLNREGKESKAFKLAKKWYFLADNKETNFDITDICCDILKKEPLVRYQKETNTLPIIGTMASESQDRGRLYVRHGCNIYDGKKSISKPLSIFTESDIWEYAKVYNIKFCSLYYEKELKDGTIIPAETRTGCVACGMGCHLEKTNRFESLSIRNPKHFENIMKFQNNGVTFQEAYNHTFNFSPEYKTKTYQSKFFNKCMQDLENFHVVCRDELGVEIWKH